MRGRARLPELQALLGGATGAAFHGRTASGGMGWSALEAPQRQAPFPIVV